MFVVHDAVRVVGVRIGRAAAENFAENASGALALATDRIGLASSYSTTYHLPYVLAENGFSASQRWWKRSARSRAAVMILLGKSSAVDIIAAPHLQ